VICRKFTTSGTYPWSFVTQIFNSGQWWRPLNIFITCTVSVLSQYLVIERSDKVSITSIIHQQNGIHPYLLYLGYLCW
jgi:hypothetical protein